MAIWSDIDVRPRWRTRSTPRLAPWQRRPFVWLLIGWGVLALAGLAILAMV